MQPDPQEKRPSLRIAIFAALALTAGAVELVWLVVTNHPGLHAPRFVAVTMAVVLLTGSVMCVLSALGRDRLNSLLAIVVLGGFSRRTLQRGPE